MAVTNSSRGHLPAGEIKFDHIKINAANRVNKDEGKFIAGSSGIYVFFMSGYNNGKSTYIDLYLNGILDNRFYQYSERASKQFSAFWSMDFTTHDEVELRNVVANTMYVDTIYQMYFTCLLIKQNKIICFVNEKNKLHFQTFF